MKIQSIEEMLDFSNNDIIKKQWLSAEQKVKLYKDWEELMNQNNKVEKADISAQQKLIESQSIENKIKAKYGAFGELKVIE